MQKGWKKKKKIETWLLFEQENVFLFKKIWSLDIKSVPETNTAISKLHGNFEKEAVRVLKYTDQTIENMCTHIQ